MLAIPLVAALLVPQDAPAPDRLFPKPSGPMILTPEVTPTYGDLIEQYAALTGQLIARSTQTDESFLFQLPLQHSMIVPAEEVQWTFECLLAQDRFVLVPHERDGAQSLTIRCLKTEAGGGARLQPTYLSAADLHIAKEHPAVLFRTVVPMPTTNTRFLTNALRTVLVDGNVQELVPAGESSSVVVSDMGPALHSWSRLLKDVEAASAASFIRGAMKRHVVRLENRPSDEVALLLAASFATEKGAPKERAPRFLPDAASNSIVVSAPAHQHAEIEQVIRALDVN